MKHLKLKILSAVALMFGLGFCGFLSKGAVAAELKTVEVRYNVSRPNNLDPISTSSTIQAYERVRVVCSGKKVEVVTDVQSTQTKLLTSELSGDCASYKFDEQIEAGGLKAVNAATWLTYTAPGGNYQKGYTFVYSGSKDQASNKKVWITCDTSKANNGLVMTTITNNDGESFSIYDANCTKGSETYVNETVRNALTAAGFDTENAYEKSPKIDNGGGNGNGNGNGNGGSQNPGAPMTYGDVDQSASILKHCAEVDENDGHGAGIRCIIELVIDVLTVGVGVVGVLGITIVGVQYLTSGGNEEKAKKAKRRLLELVIGIVLYVIAYAVLKWLVPGFNS